MINLQPKKLYSTTNCGFFVYPAERMLYEPQIPSLVDPSVKMAVVKSCINWWSSHFNCLISYIAPGEVFCVAAQGTEIFPRYHRFHIVSKEAVGWIIIPKDDLRPEIKEVKE